jgi:serine/threonine protein kinase
MAPEQMESHAYGPPVDVYAFAMLLYEMVCHRMPFQDLTVDQCTEAVTQGRRPDLPRHQDHAICKLIGRCWEHDPQERPTFKKIWKHMCRKNCVFDGADRKAIPWIKDKAKALDKQTRKSERVVTA